MRPSKTESWQRIHSTLTGSRNRFLSQLENIQQTQTQQLSRILRQNEHSEFGRLHGFAEINNYDDFVQAVPIQSYESLSTFLTAQANDPTADLICFEQTGGSTQGSKLIPYTQASLQSFQSALWPWLDDLLLVRPDIKQGSAYWSISPVLRKKRVTAGGHPIGLDNDALYFGNQLATDIVNTLAVDADVGLSTDLELWRYRTLYALLLADDLRFISIWSPTFLLDLLSYLPGIADELLSELKKTNASRAQYIQTACHSHPIDTTTIWPGLDTISCWTDGVSAGFIAQLQQLFPHVLIQGKGLLATEGVVTIPLSDAPSPVLAVNSGFYEFLDENNTLRQSHELQQGNQYQLILTNDSGLYRYNLGDLVQMQGNYPAGSDAPMLRFIGRGNHSSDICGEKLTDAFVASALITIDGFAMLSPCQTSKPYYQLVVSDNTVTTDAIDLALSQNPQYHYARKIGQLGSVRLKLIPDALQRYLQHQLEKGQQAGDIKPPALVTDANVIKAIVGTA